MEKLGLSPELGAYRLVLYHVSMDTDSESNVDTHMQTHIP